MAGAGDIQAVGGIVQTLPEEGMVAILKMAAAANPILALGMVLALLLAVVGLICFTTIRVQRYKTLSNPAVTRAFRAIEQDSQSHAQKMAELEGKRAAQRARKVQIAHTGRK